ncbi:MAG: DUF444 family protein [Thermodesulfobacteriota bacterium]|nr:DUF444 family protein [Thermodesulfobacteriota bacterium]
MRTKAPKECLRAGSRVMVNIMTKRDLLELYERVKINGLSPEQERILLTELRSQLGGHAFEASDGGGAVERPIPFSSMGDLYSYHDFLHFMAMSGPQSPYTMNIQSIDRLLERDRQREEDGFPRKIRIGRLIKPGKGSKSKVVVVPTTVEEKLIHDHLSAQNQEEPSGGGSGEGEEGEVIGEEPVRKENGSGAGDGQGQDTPHEIESNAYDLGRILTEQFHLPNLKDKGKKRSLTRYTYEMTDKHQGFGQILDKKATLKKILETNHNLGNLPEDGQINPADLLMAPSDKIYRILSREKDYESQAMVFFLRDYSGSMWGKPTELIVTQHVLIYSWLLYQYEGQVECRFILHDTEAKEVPDFYTYYNLMVAGGTKVASAYKLVNEMVEKDNLKADYNIYVFHGTDGDDWDKEGRETVPELEKMLSYANRVGITIATRSYDAGRTSELARYIEMSGLLKKKGDLLKIDTVLEDSGEKALIEGIRKLMAD